MDVVFISIFVLEDGDFIKVITSGTKCTEYFLSQSKGDFISYKTMQLSKEYYLDIQDYLNTASKKALMELEEKNWEKRRNLESQKSIELQKLRTEFFANISMNFKHR